MKPAQISMYQILQTTLLAAWLLVMSIVGAIATEQNKSQSPPLQNEQTISTGKSQSLWRQSQQWLQQKQAQVSAKLSNYLDQFSKTNDYRFALSLIVASLIYGLVHAAGPGHGKVLVSSYVMANNQTMSRGIILAFLSAFVQGTVAIVLVGSLVFLFNQSGATIKNYGHSLAQISYCLIIALGVYLFISLLRTRLKRNASIDLKHPHESHDHHHHDDNCGCNHGHMPTSQEVQGKWDLPKIISLVLSVGLRPCTGALYILAFALVKGLFWVGAIAVYAMALGTAITISIMIMAVVSGRQLALFSSGENSKGTSLVYDVCAFGGAIVIVLFGSLLLASSFAPARPF